jgi:DNA-binding XRE family transcriptional regulator
MIRVIDVRYAGGYKLAMTFSDGTLGVADLTGEVTRKRLAPLRDQEKFASAIAAEHTVCWPSEDLDLAPERLYALAHGLSIPESVEQARANERTVSLRELRTSLGMTQAQLAEALDATQSEVCRIEQRDDIRLSTLRKVVQAMGGDVEVTAVVGQKRVRVAV